MSVPYYGDFAEDDTVLIPFNTFSSDDPSASVTVTTLIASDIKVHKDGGTTEIATDGATIAVNFDSRTGAHLITVDTSAHADYSTGSEYAVMIEGATVDGGNITAWVGAFSIERAGGALAVAKLIQTAVITNAAGTDVAADIIAVKAETALIVADTNELQTDDIPGTLSTIDGKIDTMDTNVDQIETAVITNAAGVDIAADIIAVKAETALIVADTNELQTDNIPGTLSTIDGKIDTIDGIVDNILTDTGTTLQAELDGIQADTEDLQTQIGAAGAGLSAVPWNAAWDAEVQSEVTDSLVAHNLDHLCLTATAGADMTTEVADNTILSRILAAGDTSAFVPSTDSLQNIRDEVVVVDGIVDNILTDTADMQPRVAAIETDTSTTLQAELDGIQADTEDIQTQIGTAGAGLTDLGGMSTGMKAEVEAEALDALEGVQLDHLVGVTTGVAADGDLTTHVVDGSILSHLMTTAADTSAFNASTESLQAVRDHIGDGTNLTEAGGNGDHLTEAGGTGDQLTAINLPNQTMDITGDITGNLSGSVGSVTGAVGSVTGHTAQTGDTFALANGATGFAAIDTVADAILAMLDDARAEPGQGAPAVNPDAMTKLDYLYKFMRNKILTSATEIKVYNDAGDTIDQKSTISDDGTDFTRGEFGTGA